MTDNQFDCQMQMLSAILSELQSLRGLIEKMQAPKAINILGPSILGDLLQKKEGEETLLRILKRHPEFQNSEEQ